MSETSVVTIGFKTPPHKDGHGMALPRGSDFPKMRGRKKFVPKDMIKLLDDALEGLSEASCSFWACQGPSYPRNMITCNKCYAMRRVVTVRETLVRSIQ